MIVSQEKLKELLVGPGFISASNFNKAVEEAKNKRSSLDDILIDANLIKDEQLGRLVADSIKEQFIDLKQEKIEKDLIKLLPESVASYKGIIVFQKEGETIKIGMADPTDQEMRRLLEQRFGGKVKIFLITKRDCERALSNYKESLKEGFAGILENLSREDLPGEERDASIVKVVDMIVGLGYENKASDIHIEPHEDKILIRFRIDGVMHDILDISKTLFDFIVSRIKILSKMRTDEHFSPQDGKFRFQAPGENIDIRVSVMPTVLGEKIVMRILSAKNRELSLEDLGLQKENFNKIINAIKNPHGMILVTGPTGSGKTTTVYSVMKILNTREVNITTIEDPIEYYIDGVSQTQVNVKADLTFAKGLRSIVRQDPDIIMVGEIRDEETADIAINSALTGHLVLSTLHTNDAATTMPRLLDMGVEPFLVASTVNIAIGQRLIRKICTKCRVSAALEEEEIRILELMPQVKKIINEAGHNDLKSLLLYKGAGCDVCGYTGFSGRIGIFEVMEMDHDLRELIVARASSENLAGAAIKNGMSTMLEDGIKKAFAGLTTIMEVIRLTKE